LAKGSASRFGSLHTRKTLAAEIDKEIGKVDFAEKQADRRHPDVRHERRNDLAEGRADDDATAMSSTFRRMANSLNSLNMPIFFFCLLCK